MSPKYCFIIFFISIPVSIIALFLEVYLIAFTFPLIGFGFLVAGICIASENSIKRGYAEFSDTSKEKIGMTISEVRQLNSMYAEATIDETNEATSGVCESCGGKIVNGVCTYCGNQYGDDNSKIITLIYRSQFGEKTFTFKGGRLTNSKIVLYPIDDCYKGNS